MALQQTINYVIAHNNDRLSLDDNFKEAFPGVEATLEQSIPVTKAYHCIESANSVKDILTFVLTTYVDNNKKCILNKSTYTCKVDLSSAVTPNFYVQGYGYLKTLPEYADAIDV